MVLGQGSSGEIRGELGPPGEENKRRRGPTKSETNMQKKKGGPKKQNTGSRNEQNPGEKKTLRGVRKPEKKKGKKEKVVFNTSDPSSAECQKAQAPEGEEKGKKEGKFFFLDPGTEQKK